MFHLVLLSFFIYLFGLGKLLLLFENNVPFYRQCTFNCFYLCLFDCFFFFFFKLKLRFISYLPLLTFLLLIFQIVNFTVDFPTFLIAMSIMNGNYNFISRNFEGKRGYENRLKLSKYLTNNINNNGFIYLQETHSSKMETVF